MSLRSSTIKYGNDGSCDALENWVTEGGYTRNLCLEEKLLRDARSITDEEYSVTPRSVPEQWLDDTKGDYGWRNPPHYNRTDQEALDELEMMHKVNKIKVDNWAYAGKYYPRDPAPASHAAQWGGEVTKMETLINKIKNVMQQESQQNGLGIGLPGIPQVYAEEDPSVNSGLNGYEQESIAYPQSANVRIVISNISMFSTSIPINDIGQLQALSNASNDWRYTLIGSSTNQPLMTLSGLINKINSMIASAVVTQPPVTQPPVTQPPVTQPPVTQPPVTQPPVITTIHVDPPFPQDMPVDDEPITPTPTEPGKVNWIPEPFFSFINNVFRK